MSYFRSAHAKMEGPSGKLGGSVDELRAAGCIQLGADQDGRTLFDEAKFNKMFFALMMVTNQNPCKGCPAYGNGRCVAYQKYHTSAQKSDNRPQLPAGKTVRQLASELGVSISEVRRRKSAGEL